MQNLHNSYKPNDSANHEDIRNIITTLETKLGKQSLMERIRETLQSKNKEFFHKLITSEDKNALSSFLKEKTNQTIVSIKSSVKNGDSFQEAREKAIIKTIKG